MTDRRQRSARSADLARDLAEAREQQAAASEVLAVIGSSAYELQPVFETVLRHATRLCHADAGQVFQLDADAYRLASAVGGSEEYRTHAAGMRLVPGVDTLTGRVALEGRPVQIEDAATDPLYSLRAAQELGGFHSMLGVPVATAAGIVAVILLWRDEVRPFSAREVDVVSTFAAQGAIAIENVRLFRELQQSVQELRALHDVTQAVSSSLDLHQVLTTIVTHAVELSGTEGGSIFEFDPDTRLFELRTACGTEPELVDALRRTQIGLDDTVVGRAAARGTPEQVADIEVAPGDAHLDRLRQAGWRSLIAVPLRRGDDILGALVVRKRAPGGIEGHTVDLLQTLASQSSVAIHNARVFRALERQSAELERASRHKSEFLASMSHELRTPLNAVIGFSDVLLDRMAGDLNERQDEYVRDIRDSGRHLLELLNEILDLSKIEAGRMELDRQAVPLPPLLEHCVTMVRERAQEHGIALTLDVSDEVGIVSADNLRVKQVILNLLTNAVKFTPDGGAVTVGAHRDRDDVVVTVRDTGIGIAESQQERIFDAFQQGGRTPSSAEGTGLGLTLTKRMVELHGGRIRVDSRPGEGSTFTVVLPVGEPVPEAPELAPKPADELAGPLVLVIEDDRHSLDLLTLYLRSAGFAVASAREGDVGLAMARRLRPAAVVLDILLPNIDGWSLLGRLKSDDATADIPVIIVSMLDERGRGFALGAADYLVKPVGRNEVLAAVGRCAPVPTAGRRVVVIDDDETSCSLVRAVLEQAGYEVRCAGGGEEGVQLVCDTRPDVVLLDLLMPHVDGFEVIDRVRADPATAEVPIVVLSAKTMTSGDIERLRGQISFLARKGDTDAAGLAELVRRAADGPRTVEETWQAS